MAKQKQSNTETISPLVVAFIGAFCRKDLSIAEVRMISDIFNAALSSRPRRWRERVFLLAMRNAWQEVLLKPSGSQSNPLVSHIVRYLRRSS